jgi:hypothetical protein
MNNSTKEIQTLENRFIKLTTLQCALESADKVSYEIALEAENLVPGKSILDRYFSGVGAVENKKITMESFSAELWVIVAAAIAAAIAAIVGLIKLFKGGGSGSSSGGSGAPSLVPAAKIESRVEIEKKASVIASGSVTSNIQHIVNGPKPQTPDLTTLEKIQTQFGRLSAVTVDILTDGPYKKKITELANIVMHEDPQITVSKYVKELLYSYPPVMEDAIEVDSKNTDLEEFKERNRSFIKDETAPANVRFIEVKNAFSEAKDLLSGYSNTTPNISGLIKDPLKILDILSMSRSIVHSEQIAKNREHNESYLASAHAGLELAEENVNSFRDDKSNGRAERWVGNVFFGRISDATTRVKNLYMVYDTLNTFEKQLAKAAEEAFVLLELSLQLTHEEDPTKLSKEDFITKKSELVALLKEYK